MTTEINSARDIAAAQLQAALTSAFLVMPHKEVAAMFAQELFDHASAYGQEFTARMFAELESKQKAEPPKQIMVGPNESFGPGPFYEGWICEHAAPQNARFKGHVILCEQCAELYVDGAHIVNESGQRIMTPDAT